MKILVHRAPSSIKKDLGYIPDNVGILSSPRRFYSDVNKYNLIWAADNDAYLSWNLKKYVYMVERISQLDNCLFITLPDVVGDHVATLNLYELWRDEVKHLPRALVAQDGLKPEHVPWEDIFCLFIGGTTDWKLSENAKQLAREAKIRGKWLHMGRVNSLKRIRIAHNFGCDSIDGTCFSRYTKVYLKRYSDYIKSLK
jgi:hypothetical protein